ncbi:unnamed protein product [Meloidogyne enterolobii]|uniref:Uncharacterized protein n=1 Tax=Meloidogyne enterolobii TaxID=390850 RepID=A0ACB0Z148_MELEN
MGCKGPKSLVELSNGMNFLEFVLRQHEVNIKKILIFRNSELNKKDILIFCLIRITIQNY